MHLESVPVKPTSQRLDGYRALGLPRPGPCTPPGAGPIPGCRSPAPVGSSHASTWTGSPRISGTVPRLGWSGKDGCPILGASHVSASRRARPPRSPAERIGLPGAAGSQLVGSMRRWRMPQGNPNPCRSLERAVDSRVHRSPLLPGCAITLKTGAEPVGGSERRQGHAGRPCAQEREPPNPVRARSTHTDGGRWYSSPGSRARRARRPACRPAGSDPACSACSPGPRIPALPRQSGRRYSTESGR